MFRLCQSLSFSKFRQSCSNTYVPSRFPSLKAVLQSLEVFSYRYIFPHLSNTEKNFKWFAKRYDPFKVTEVPRYVIYTQFSFQDFQEIREWFLPFFYLTEIFLRKFYQLNSLTIIRTRNHRSESSRDRKYYFFLYLINGRSPLSILTFNCTLESMFDGFLSAIKVKAYGQRHVHDQTSHLSSWAWVWIG